MTNKIGFKGNTKKCKVSHELFYTSVRYQTRQYFENSSLHGARYLFEEGRPFSEKFLWFLCLSVSVTVTLIIIVSLWEKFQTNPTITSIDTDFHDWNVEFPGFALCQLNPQMKNPQINQIIQQDPKLKKIQPRDKLIELLSLLGRLSYENMNELDNFAEFLEADLGNLKKLAFKVITPCNDTLSDCYWKGEKIDCCENFLPIFTEIGFCFGFNFKKYERKAPWNKYNYKKFKVKHIYETDKWEVSLVHEESASNPSRMYVLMAIDQPGVDLTYQHEWDSKVYRVLINPKTTYTTKDAEQLSIKQRHCVFPKEIPLLTNDEYTYASCMRDCRMIEAFKLCKCVPFFYDEIPNKYPHCDLKGLNCIAGKRRLLARRDICPCELGCENTNYDVEKLIDDKTERADTTIRKIGKLELSFVSWPIYRYKREVLFGWVDLLVSFGGIAGLFLGFSLLSGVEIIYYFTIRTCCMFARDQEKLKDIQKDYDNEEKPPLDLSLVPRSIRKN